MADVFERRDFEILRSTPQASPGYFEARQSSDLQGDRRSAARPLQM
jgi:hypothetical protein